MKRQAAELAAALDDVRRGLLLVVTGAGVSHASGIATFRGSDEGAIWATSPMEMATRRGFERDPVRQWQWYFGRFDAVFKAEPNPAHRALAALERWHEARGGRFLLVTQNIDTLHERAGSARLVKVHGTSDRVRCSRTGCCHGAPRGSLVPDMDAVRRFRDAPSDETLPRCAECGSILRAHVLFFDEYYNEHEDYEFERVREAAAACAFALFAGTSFSVGVTDLVLSHALGRGVPVASIDPDGSAAPAGVRVYAAPAEELLPEVCNRLELELDES